MARLLMLLAMAAGMGRAATFGTTHPILGEFSDLALDEVRNVVYLSNFTANRIEVFNLAARTLQPAIRLGINPASVALSPDSRLLLILNFSSSSLFLLNLDSRAVQTVALPDNPRAGIFGADGAALIITTTQVLRYDPATGTLTTLTPIEPLLGTLPVEQPTFPAEIINARMAVSRDRGTIFAVGSVAQSVHFAFYYSVATQSFTRRGCSAPAREPIRFASISPDGSRAMGGHLLLDRQLNILADFVPAGMLPLRTVPPVPTAPPPNAPPPRISQVVGATEFSADTAFIYASLVETGAARSAPLLYLLASDNLSIHDRILIPDRLTGKMVADRAGQRLYAVSENGLTVLPVGDLERARVVATTADTISFRFNVCNKLSATASFAVVHRGPAPVDFTLATSMPGLRLSSTSGTTPAFITATFDPDQLFNVRGTSVGLIQVTSSGAVNLPEPVRVLVNLQDSDQRGTIFVQNGALRDLLVDELRERFYILDSSRNRLLVFDLNDFSLRQEVRTGNFPLHMAVAQDQRTLLIANAQSETISMINLDSLETVGLALCPCGSYGRSIAVSTNAVLLVTAVDRGRLLRTPDNQQVEVTVTEGRLARVDLASKTSREPATLGIFQNQISPRTLLTATPSGRHILIAEDTSDRGGGLAKIYEADSDTFVLARSISETDLRGGAAASDTGLFNAGAVLTSSTLNPLAEFRDTPNEHNSLVFIGSQIVRTLKPATGGGPGLITRVDTSTLRSLRPVKLAESPLGLFEDQPLRRSLAATSNGGKFITLSSSGFEVITGAFDAFVPPAVVRSVADAATFRGPVAPGSLVSIFGDNLAPLTTRAGVVPLPTFLADTCITVNNLPIPLLSLSPGQVNAQLPFEILGSATAVVHTPGGVSDPFAFEVPAAAPSLYRSTFGGQASEPLPIIFRAFNNEPVTLSNPVRRGEVLFMFGNGFGRVTPDLASGAAAPANLLLSAALRPQVTIGGRPAEVLFAGLAPNFVGLNQLNLRVPLDAPLGFNIPLVITSGGNSSETFLVRVMPELER